MATPFNTLEEGWKGETCGKQSHTEQTDEVNSDKQCAQLFVHDASSPYVVLAQIICARSCHPQYASFCCGIPNNIRHAPHSNCGGHVDNGILWCHGFSLLSGCCYFDCFLFCLADRQGHVLDPICVCFEVKCQCCIPVCRNERRYQDIEFLGCLKTVCCRRQ